MGEKLARVLIIDLILGALAVGFVAGRAESVQVEVQAGGMYREEVLSDGFLLQCYRPDGGLWYCWDGREVQG